MNERLRSLLLGSATLVVAGCASSSESTERAFDAYYADVTERREMISAYTRSIALIDLLATGECQTMDSVPVYYEETLTAGDTQAETVEPIPRVGPTLRERFRTARFSNVETQAAYMNYRFHCTMAEEEMWRPRIRVPDEPDSEREPE